MNLTLSSSERAKLLPCPFCGTGGQALELCNTHTPAYWIQCQECGAEVHGEEFASSSGAKDVNKRLHVRAKRAAIAAWNQRTPPAVIVDHYRQAALVARAMVSSCAFDGSAQKALQAWLKRDGELRKKIAASETLGGGE